MRLTTESKPQLAIPANVRPPASPRSSGRTTPDARTEHAVTGFVAIPSARHRSLPRPPGSTPTTPSVCFNAPATAPINPSPPNATATSPAAAASTASSRAWARLFVYSKRCSRPKSRRAACTAGSARAGRPPPATGVTINASLRTGKIMPNRSASAPLGRVGTLRPAWRSASTSDFFSSPLGGNSAWAAARSRETSTEKKPSSRHQGVT